MQYCWPELDSDGADDSEPALDEAEPLDDDQAWLALLADGLGLALADPLDGLLDGELEALLGCGGQPEPEPLGGCVPD